MDNEGTQIQSGTDTPDAGSWLDKLPVEAKNEILKLREENAKTRKKVGLDEKEAEIEELKRKIKEKESKDLEEKQQFKELYETTKKEKSELEKLHKGITEKYQSLEAEYETERVSLLDKLPDDMKSEFSNSSKRQLQILLSQLTKSGNSPGTKKPGIETMDIESMSLEEQLKLNAENPELFNQLKTKQLRNRRIGV